MRSIQSGEIGRTKKKKNSRGLKTWSHAWHELYCLQILNLSWAICIISMRNVTTGFYLCSRYHMMWLLAYDKNRYIVTILPIPESIFLLHSTYRFVTIIILPRSRGSHNIRYILYCNCLRFPLSIAFRCINSVVAISDRVELWCIWMIRQGLSWKHNGQTFPARRLALPRE